MKEIAVIGANGTVMSHVLSRLLENGMAVNVMTLFPERVMVENVQLTVSHIDVASHDKMRQSLVGYDTVVITNETDLTNKELNDLALKYYNSIVNAAIEAGVKRVLVVGGKESSAFYTGDLKRHDDVDWVFTTTEGDFASRIAHEVAQGRNHRCEVLL